MKLLKIERNDKKTREVTAALNTSFTSGNTLLCHLLATATISKKDPCAEPGPPLKVEWPMVTRWHLQLCFVPGHGLEHHAPGSCQAGWRAPWLPAGVLVCWCAGPEVREEKLADARDGAGQGCEGAVWGWAPCPRGPFQPPTSLSRTLCLFIPTHRRFFLL